MGDVTIFFYFRIGRTFRSSLATMNFYTIVTAYSLKDMAADVTNLLDLLNIPKAFICGFSLGAMIAQNMAFAFPGRMSGLICMGSSSGDRQLPPPKPEAQAAMGTPAPPTRQGYIDHTVAVFKTFSNGSPFYDAQCRSAIAGASYDRCFYPPGFVRQSVAMLADGSRKERLDQVTVPTLVLHGELDPVAQPVHGEAIAAAVPDAQMALLPQWGHGMDYPKLWPRITQDITMFCSSQRD